MLKLMLRDESEEMRRYHPSWRFEKRSEWLTLNGAR